MSDRYRKTVDLDEPLHYRPSLGSALRDADDEKRDRAEKVATEQYEREHLCGTCFHAPVCSVSIAVATMSAASGAERLVWIGRCGHYTELPSMPEPEAK